MSRIPDVRTTERSASLLGAGRRLFLAVWEHAGTRLELFALELAEERSRLIAAVVAAAGLVACVALAMAFAGVALLVAAWDTPHRMLVVIVIMIGYAMAGVVAWRSLQRLTGRQSALFRHSLAEWRRDVDALRPGIEPKA